MPPGPVPSPTTGTRSPVLPKRRWGSGSVFRGGPVDRSGVAIGEVMALAPLVDPPLKWRAVHTKSAFADSPVREGGEKVCTAGEFIRRYSSARRGALLPETL